MSKVRKSAQSVKNAESSSGSSSSLSSDEEVDMQDLKSIKEYLSDRRELARQLFKSVKAEKIQMMLPQILKKMDLCQLEEWCANELSGMSKARILCILNGKSMTDSSDTTESDDSGPSLEIISDTEEWFTDEDLLKKEAGSQAVKGKVNKDRVKQKVKLLTQKKGDNKAINKKTPDNVPKNVQIKKEEEMDKRKEKEGDSLLDLLELEMRARAIRALIRKEEDIVPNAAQSVVDNNVANARNKSEQDEQKEKESCRRQLERIIGAQQSSNVEDEDVVLVVQPTTTIELLSSESEGETHGGVRINKKLQNERVMETEENVDLKNKETNTAQNSFDSDNLKENNVTDNASETHKNEASKRLHSDNLTDSDAKINTKRKKVKRRSHTKEQQKNTSSKSSMHKVKSHSESQHKKSTKNDASSNENVKSNESEVRDSNTSKVHDKLVLKKEDPTENSEATNKVNLDEEKSSDLDEIIDLDNYCDIDDIENSENDKNKKKQITKTEQNKSETETLSAQKPNGAETWASRYYQTDDVQNVIKDSKIQSEIRKRLRERQRLSKLSGSPNKNSPSSSPVIETVNKNISEGHPLGSVDEYLALKQTAAASLNSGGSSSDSNIASDNVASSNNSTDMRIAIETDHTSGLHSNEQKCDQERNSNTKNEGIINTVINTNPG
ncbi:uncharacterized protein LOC143352473 [Halictus rubicundus]|uniref:uncharacterized protein LOC143352473 n=1 Tax=Halictus rubicundus TaxID=77578 RepID=UPI004035B1B1